MGVLQIFILTLPLALLIDTTFSSPAVKVKTDLIKELKLEWPSLNGASLQFDPKSNNNDNLRSSFGGKAQDDEPNPNVVLPIVETPLGQLMGKTMQSRAGRYYYAFLGIPYTQTPKRFQPSVLIESFGKKFLDAKNVGSVCPQPGGPLGVQGDENCLFLNIYYPHSDLCKNASASGKLPVMYNIHGGSYTSGHGAFFDPKYLMDECVVYVSVNYRLGALGFLTTDDGLIPGNLGLKDQVVGLEFVQKYIKYFRGDRDLVTILGISAGGSSVSHLVTSPTTKGMIHRAIASSGNVLNPWSITENPGTIAKALGKNLNCSTDTTAALKECLEGVKVKDIVLQQSQTGAQVPFTPVVEVASEEKPFQNQNPVVRYRNGDFNRIPLIAGFVEDEGIMMFGGVVPTELMSLLNNHWNLLAPSILLYDQLGFSQEKRNKISADIRTFYFGDQPIGPETRQNLTDLFSDRHFVQGTFETVELHSKFAPAYPYLLSYKGGYSFAWHSGYQIPAVTHGDDAQYLYTFQDFKCGTEQYEFSRNMVKLWTSFAVTGRPVGHEPTGDSWKATEGRANNIWFDFNIPTKNLVNYLETRRTFWENVGIYETEHF